MGGSQSVQGSEHAGGSERGGVKVCVGQSVQGGSERAERGQSVQGSKCAGVRACRDQSVGGQSMRRSDRAVPTWVCTCTRGKSVCHFLPNNWMPRGICEESVRACVGPTPPQV